MTADERTMKAHQFLYYVCNQPIWTDYEYDMWCKRHGLEGGGGSDIASSYSLEVRALASAMLCAPSAFPHTQ